MGSKPDFMITAETFENLISYWLKPSYPLRWEPIFALPTWLEIWWKEFGATGDLYLCAVRERGAVIGIAPLLFGNEGAFFIGSDDVCDYLDFIVVPGREHDFFNILLDDLNSKGLGLLNLRPLRPDSTVFTHLMGIVRERGYEVSYAVEDVSLELDLPPTWEEYFNVVGIAKELGLTRGLQRKHLEK